MGLRGRTVQRQRDGLGPGLVQLDEAGAGEPGGDRRGQGDAQADPGSVCDELGQVGPLEWVAPGHDHQRARRPERREVVQELPALVGGELEGVAGPDRLGPAVRACELARAGDLPDHDEGPFRGVVVHEPHRSLGCWAGTTSPFDR
jgi:hypothetical protein